MSSDSNSDLETFLAKAELITTQASAAPLPPVYRRRRGALIAGACAVVAASAITWAASRGDDSDSSTADSLGSTIAVITNSAASVVAVQTSSVATTASTTRTADTVPPGTEPVPTLPPLSAPVTPVTLPPVAVSLAPPSSDPPDSTPDSAPTSTEPAAVPGASPNGVTGVAPIAAQQKGQLFVLSGSVRSQADGATLLKRLVGVPARRLRNETYVNPDSAPLPENLVVTVRDGLQFASGQSQIDSATGKLALDAIGDLINSRPDIVVRIEGHTDSQGSDQYNLNLSRLRAQAAREYLRRKGVNVARVQVEAAGETRPIASNDTQVGRLANRRLEISISGLLKG